MNTTALLPVRNGDILATLRDFLAGLLEKGVIDALLVPQEIGGGRSLKLTLVRDADHLDGANPFSPVMPDNGAIHVSKLTKGGSDHRLGAVLRSCEIRALVELVKLKQANLDNLVIIGVDCLGTYEVDDYARLIDEMDGPAGGRGAQIVAELRAAISNGGPNSLRPACQMCEFPIPKGADITLELIGVEDGVLVTLDEGLAEKLGLTPGEAPEREAAITGLVEKRSAARDQAFAEYRKKAATITGFADMFATCQGCYNCSVACPICYCKQCFFRTETFEHDSESYFRWAERKGALQMPTENLLYQLTRMNHMVASCVGCGLCESACPSGLPLVVAFRAVGQGVQKKLDYVPGRSLDDPLPVIVYREEDTS
ncbi:MAG: 4Fe-4S dicluster domain-containing protein [Anaerolineae bacterium]